MSKILQEEQKEKKIVFSKEVDSLIDGLTLAFAFIIVGLFLLLVPDYFGSKLVGQVVRWVFIIIGSLGLLTEFGKLKPISNIKGLDSLWVGALLLGGWAALFFLAESLFLNIVGFILMVIGLYGTLQGLFQIIYSVQISRKNKTQSSAPIISDLLVFLTKIVSLTLVVFQLIKAIQ